MNEKFREESEAVSELKHHSETQSLPQAALINRSESIKQSLSSFSDAKISDLENERLPPDLIPPTEVEGFEDFGSSTRTSPRVATPVDGINFQRSESPISMMTSTSGWPETPMRERREWIGTGSGSVSPSLTGGHSRTSSMGTTMTSPSNRKRSLENTISMIR
jgi:serine/threonine-protein phosphatase 2B catalytic subunit